MSSIFHRVIEAQNSLYESCGLKAPNLIPESESKEYYAHYYELENRRIRFRISKLTPNKSGQFVTIWKRIDGGVIQPYDYADDIDYFVINFINEDKIGQFVFPKDVPVKKNIFSKNQRGGKRGIRVYSPWDITTSPQAQSTQDWQKLYFLDITSPQIIDIKHTKSLYSIT